MKGHGWGSVSSITLGQSLLQFKPYTNPPLTLISQLQNSKEELVYWMLLGCGSLKISWTFEYLTTQNTWTATSWGGLGVVFLARGDMSLGVSFEVSKGCSSASCFWFEMWALDRGSSPRPDCLPYSRCGGDGSDLSAAVSPKSFPLHQLPDHSHRNQN